MNNASNSTGTAIVLGGSITGLLAARVLADFYSDVIVAERDAFPDGPSTRRGVPQGGLPHILAARGAQIVDQLFDGFLDELTPAHGRVTGVVVARRDSGAEKTLAADLVVDATGRGSRAPVFLEQLGYGRPREDELKYTSLTPACRSVYRPARCGRT